MSDVESFEAVVFDGSDSSDVDSDSDSVLESRGDDQLFESSRGSADPTNELVLHVCGLAGPICTVRAQFRWTVLRCKQEIQKLSGISFLQQRLLLGHFEPSVDSMKLNEFVSAVPEQMEANASLTLTLVRRTRDQLRFLRQLRRLDSHHKYNGDYRCYANEGYFVSPAHILARAPSEIRADKEMVLAAVQKSHRGDAAEFGAGELRDDADFMRRVIAVKPRAMRFASQRLRQDKIFMLDMISLDVELAMSLVARSIIEDSDFMWEAVQRNGLAILYATERQRGDRRFMLMAAKQNGVLALQVALQPLRSDREIVLAAVLQSAQALQHAHQSLTEDKGIVLAAAHKDGCAALELAGERLRADKMIVAAAVQQNGLALQHAEVSLRADKETVLAAVGNAGLALQFASAELRADLQVVLSAVLVDGMSLEFASDDLRSDRHTVLVALKTCSRAMKFASVTLKVNADFMLMAGKIDKHTLQFADSSLNNNYSFMRAVVELDGLMLRFAEPAFTEDADLALAAVRENASSMQHVSKQLKADESFLERALQITRGAADFSSRRLQLNRHLNSRGPY